MKRQTPSRDLAKRVTKATRRRVVRTLWQRPSTNFLTARLCPRSMADDGECSSSAQPLRGVVLCCTSIPPEQRSELASHAEQMGAAHKLDLTSDVTHLIVGDSDTPKYKYVAKERPDVMVLTPSWIDNVRQLWMAGEQIDIAALEEEHRRPALAGLRVCLTGFDDRTCT